LLTYTSYITRAEGAGSAAAHDKPWYYYLALLTYTYRQAGPRWTEALTLLLALVGAVASLWPSTRTLEAGQNLEKQALIFKRFLTFYALLILLLFTIVPYKTPWNLLVFYHAAALLAGIGASAILYTGRWYFMQLGLVMALLAGNFLLLGGIGANAIAHIGCRTVQGLLCLLLLAGVAHIGYQSYQGNFIYPADTRNPYVYAHPSTSLRRLTTRIDDIAAIAPESTNLHINVIRPDGDYWPLPWYLRKYTKVGWWRNIPEKPDAAIILAAPELYDVLQERLHDDYLVEFHALRPGMLLHAYIRRDLWDAFMQTRQ